MEKKQSENSKSIFRNVLYGFSTWLLPLGLSFFATPVILKSIGHEDYGIYALVLGFVGYSFNFSFGRAVTKYISEYRAGGASEKISGIVSTAFFINLLIGLLGVAVICLSAQWLVANVFNIASELQNKTIYSLYLAALIVFGTMQNQIFTSILQGFHRFDLYSKIFNFGNFLLLSGNIVLALSGFGLIGLFVWNLCVVCISGLIYALSVRRLFPGIRLLTKPEPGNIKLIFHFSAGVIGYQILSNFLVLFERGWISGKLGVENLTYYTVSMTVAIYIAAFISSLIMVIFPLASELKNDKPKLLRLYLKATKIVSGLVVFFALTLIIESRVFLSLWMGEAFAEQTVDMLVIHTITFALSAVLSVSWQMTEGLGYPVYNCLLIFICLIVTIFLITRLTPVYQTEAVAFSKMAGVAVIFPSIFIIEKWFFGKIQTAFWSKLVLLLSLPVLTASVAEKYIIERLPLDWLAFTAAGAAGGVVYFSTLWLVGFINEDEKALFEQLLHRRKLNEKRV